ncbi:MAG: transposase [Gammaproteobacteria bacterium]|jgi:hypothetical protein|nr:transposase [Gammaproteobacteria bacterium]
METQCKSEQLEFHALGRWEIVGRFDGGRITSDGGGLSLREVDTRIGPIPRLADCFVDYRNPQALDRLLVDVFIESYRLPPREIWPRAPVRALW